MCQLHTLVLYSPGLSLMFLSPYSSLKGTLQNVLITLPLVLPEIIKNNDCTRRLFETWHLFETQHLFLLSFCIPPATERDQVFI